MERGKRMVLFSFVLLNRYYSHESVTCNISEKLHFKRSLYQIHSYSKIYLKHV